MSDKNPNLNEDQLETDGRKWRIPEWFPDLEEDVLRQLRIFHFELISFNGRMNLISPRTEKEADAVHFADSILACRVILANSQCKEIFDIGSGNGLPGLVMACLAKDRQIICIDSDSRKVEFLKHAAHRMGLKNVSCRQTRIEDIEARSIECAVSRGFASVSKALVSTRKQFKAGGEYFHMKGDGWVREVADIPSQIIAAWKPRLLSEYELPNNGPRLAIVVTRRLD